jgi:two-component system cell cycle response regulator
LNILIAEDDPIQRRILRAQLTRLGYTVREVADGELAWDYLQHEQVPIVITDWLMPNLEGPRLIERIRSAGFTAYTYVILLTAKDGRGDVVAGLEAGADDYLTKPFDSNELRARVAIGARIVDLEARLREARDTDGLTGLHNRRAIMSAAEAEQARAQREDLSFSIALLDVDHFKRVNDQYGHQVGDLALRTVAAAVTQSVRPYDRVGRWGGEELLLLLPRTGPAEAALIGERVRTKIAATPLRLEDGQLLSLTASIGVSSAPPAQACTVDELVHQADAALYRAKAKGRNRVCAHQPSEPACTA